MKNYRIPVNEGQPEFVAPIVDVVEKQRKRRERYEDLIKEASCEDEIAWLRKAYEISRLLYIKDELVIERNNQMLKV